jgi:serine protease Do
VSIEVLRQGEEETVAFKLGRFDETRTAALDRDSQGDHEGLSSDRLGATLAPITPAAREQLGLDDSVDGVVITSLDGKGAAADAGLAVGDVILQVAGTDVRNPGDVDDALHAAKTDAVLMQIERNGSKIFVGVRLA